MKATTISSCLLTAMTLISSRCVRADIVTLDDNGGFGGSGSIEVTYGEPMPWVDMPQLDYEHQFKGYYDQDGKMYIDKWCVSASDWDKHGDCVLHAEWAECTYFYLDMQDGSDVMFWYQAMPGDVLPMIPVETRPGYIFGGAMIGDELYFDETGNPTKPWVGGNGQVECTIVCIWTPIKVKAILTHGQASGIADREIEIEYNDWMYWVEPPVWHGHTFLGYCDEWDNYYIGNNGYANMPWPFLEETTLYAKWELAQVVITYANKTGHSWSYSRLAEYDGPLPEITMPEERGYVFLGLYDDQGVQYYDSKGHGVRTVDKVENFSLTARWESTMTAAELTEKLSTGGAGEHIEIVLRGPISGLDSELLVSKGEDVVIDLNGFEIDRGLEGMAAVVSGGVIRVEGILTIKDSFGGGRIMGGNVVGNGGGILVAKNGVLRLLGGTVCGNTATCAGGGVYGEKHSAVFLGAGKVLGNRAKNGCGIEIPYGTFRLCDETSHEAEECNLQPYSSGLILMFK